MSETQRAYIDFVSATTASLVHVEIGFLPDEVQLIADYTGTPRNYRWFNPARFPGYLATDTLVLPGGSAANSVDTTTLIQVYPGAETVNVDETDNTAGKHVNRAGAAAPAGHLTSAGVTIAAAAQTNSGRNMLIALRGDGA